MKGKLLQGLPLSKEYQDKKSARGDQISTGTFQFEMVLRWILIDRSR